MAKKKQEKYPPLEIVWANTYCQYTPIENRLRIISQNQEKIYLLLQKILETRTGG